MPAAPFPLEIVMDIKNFIRPLLSISLFKDFTEETLLPFFRPEAYQIKTYAKNNIIYLQNEKCTTVDVILKGEIIVQKIEPTGSVLTVADFGVGEVIGGNLVFAHHNNYPMTISAKSSCVVLHIRKELILELCQQNKSFLLGFLQSVSDKTLVLTDKIKAITMKTIRQCIIEFLTYEYYLQGSPEIKLEMSKNELAERLGVQRPSLSRELGKMREEGILDFDGKRIVVRDLGVLGVGRKSLV